MTKYGLLCDFLRSVNILAIPFRDINVKLMTINV